MTKIEFTKEWILENNIAICCKTKQEADLVCFIYKIDNNDFNEDNQYLEVYADRDTPIMCSFYSFGYIKRCKIIYASEVIAKYEASNRKIIGYRCPFDLVNCKIKKGSIYKIIT